MSPRTAIAILAVALAALAGSAAAAVEQPRPLQLTDILAVEYAYGPQISPDGEAVAFALSSPDAETDSFQFGLFLVDAAGGAPRSVPGSDGFAGGHVWSPDGTRLAFAASGEQGPEIRIHDRRSGETRVAVPAIGRFPSALSWSPDGRRLAFSSFIAEPARRLVETIDRPEGARERERFTVIDRLGYRRASGSVRPNGRRQIFVADVESGDVTRVTRHARSVGKLGDGLHWSPDGRHLYATADAVDAPDRRPFAQDIVRVDIATGSVEPVAVRRGYEGQLSLSPDGRQLAYIAFHPDYPGNPEQRQARVRVIDLDGGGDREISGALDRSVMSPQWTPDGRAVLGVYEDQGVTELAAFSLDGRRRVIARELGSGPLGYNMGAGFSVSASGAIAYTFTTARRPGDVALVDLSTGERRAATAMNAELLAARDLAEIGEFSFRSSADGREIQGWYLLPPGYDPSRSWPAILEVHGGPHAAYGPRWDIEKQLYAAAGYVVVMVNPRGSTGYGSDFIAEIFGAYPGKDVGDLDAAMDAVAPRLNLDPERLYVAGGSGGGVLAGALTAQTDRFRAAAVLYPITDWRSYMMAAAPWVEVMSATFEQPAWSTDPSYAERSLVTRAGEVSTPTLVMVGERDHQTPVFQAEGYYRALRWNGVESVLVIAPDETHGIRDHPSHFMEKLATVLAWFEAH